MRLLAVERTTSVLRSAEDDAAAARAAVLCTVHGLMECDTAYQHYLQPAFLLPVAMRVPTIATVVVLT
jgi:hypothetical protein